MDTKDALASIEKKLKIKLEEITDVRNYSYGYVKSDDRVSGLSLYSCHIGSLQRIIDELIALKLEQLNLRYTQIRDITPIKKLKKLKHLNLRGNAIYDISPLSELQHLNEINLSFNQIQNIESLKKLNELRLLDARTNKVQIIPSWLVDVNSNLIFEKSGIVFEENNGDELGILLNDNPIISPPIEVINQGNDAIQRYFEQIKDEGVDYIYEAKLILVGEGSAGKTSLQLRLRNPNASLPSENSRTRGIHVHDWVFKNEGSKKHVAHIWDFGGQDMYYPVHRFFLTESSVFVLMASTRQSHHNFDYWIPTIYQFGGQSPIIIGQTRHEGALATWNELGYFLSNPLFNIVKTKALPYYELNLPNSNAGLDSIKSVVIDQITNLPHYGKGVPKSWVQIRERMFKEIAHHHYISFEKFDELCKEVNPIAFNNREIVEDCASFLHAIGILLWYSKTDTLKDWVILQPEWAMNAVYKIIDDAQIQNNNGNITIDDFKRLWTGDYHGKHGILKKMLEEFKIAFPKKNANGEYILPAQLSSMPENERWSENEKYISIEYYYEFMPKGLINQLSAELNGYIHDEKAVWNNAVNFSDDSRKSFCQVEENFFFQKITLKARGKDGRGLLLVVMDMMKNITNGYKGVKPKIIVPCTCETCKKDLSPTRYLYGDLLRWGEKKDTVYCNEGDTFLSIEALLRDVGLNQSSGSNHNIIKIFLASSSELAGDRKEFEIFINRENKKLIQKGIFIDLVIWEDFIDSMSKTRLQDEYNQAATESDIFVSLFFSKVGEFTKEEFSSAFKQFHDTSKPRIYTFFKNSQVNMQEIREEDILSKFAFEKYLRAIGHYPTIYDDATDLMLKFKSQLDLLLLEQN